MRAVFPLAAARRWSAAILGDEILFQQEDRGAGNRGWPIQEKSPGQVSGLAAAGGLQDFRFIAGEIAYRGIDLGKGYSHLSAVTGRQFMQQQDVCGDVGFQ